MEGIMKATERVGKIPKRPSINDKNIIENAAVSMAPAMTKQFHRLGFYSATDEESKTDILTAVDGCYYPYDGYEMAKALEDATYISPDTELVEELDNFISHLHRACYIACRDWAKAYQPTAHFNVGDTMWVKERTSSFMGRVSVEWHQGVVTEINQNAATYTICSESMGHTKDGVGIKGVIKNWEDVDAEQQEREAAVKSLAEEKNDEG